MKIFAPKYYEKFKCIADKCKNSCCIGWEIDIDKVTLEKYNSILHPYSEKILQSIDNSDSPHFILDCNKNCPHLDEKGLCKIILNVGEEYICDICREHPRFYNFTNHGKEIGIGMSCEAACDLILSSDDFDDIVQIGEDKGKIKQYEFDAIKERDKVYYILKDDSLEIDGKVEALYDYFDVFLYRYYFPKIISKLEYLNDEHKILFSKAKYLKWNKDISKELTRILAYFVYRHCSEAYDYDEFFASLSFAIFCTGLVSVLSNKETVNEIARIVSEEIEYSETNTEKIKALFQ